MTATLLEGRGDELPVSAFAADGTFPTSTARLEKRSLADEIPNLGPGALHRLRKVRPRLSPHAAIRMKVFPPEALEGAPVDFPSKEWRDRHLPGCE